MPHDPITTYLTTCDPKIGQPWSTDEDGLPVVPPLRECEQWLQLESLNDLWLDAVAGRPAQFEHPDVQPAFRAMQSAAAWQARFPHHPALAALELSRKRWLRQAPDQALGDHDLLAFRDAVLAALRGHHTLAVLYTPFLIDLVERWTEDRWRATGGKPLIPTS